MDIETIKKEKEILEKTIYKLILDFNSKTKVLPDAIYLDIVTTPTIGKSYSQSLYKVRVDVKI